MPNICTVKCLMSGYHCTHNCIQITYTLIPSVTCRSNVMLLMYSSSSIVTEQLITPLSFLVRHSVIVGVVTPSAKQPVSHCHEYIGVMLVLVIIGSITHSNFTVLPIV